MLKTINPMKKLFSFSFAVLALLFIAGCNTPTATETQPLSFEQQMQSSSKGLPIFKMIPTDNIHILLKWNTRTGEVWMTQYALSDTDALEQVIPSVLNIKSENSWNGRFELYPTKNMFNFIMVDTYYGNTYQVQWSFKNDNCFVMPIS